MTVFLILLGVVVIFIFLAGIFSGFETGLYVCDVLTLRGKLQKREKGAFFLDRLIRHRKSAVIVLLLFTNISLFLASSAFTNIVKKLAITENEFLTALISSGFISPVVVVFAEMVPKDLFRLRSYPLLYRFSLFIYIIYYTLSLLATPLKLFVRRWSTSEVNSDTVSFTKEDVEARLREDLIPTSLLSSMVKNVLRLSELRLKDVMVPSFVTVTVQPNATIEDVMRLSRIYRYSRMPVMESFETRNVLGVLNIFDMFYTGASTVKDVMRPPLTLKDDATLRDALFLMRVHRSHLAIVTDSTGLFIGIVTIKDLIEEITGELRSW